MEVKSYLKLFITYFFITTPFLVAVIFASIPEAITVKPIVSMRIFFIVIALGLYWVLNEILENQFKKHKYKTRLIILSMTLSSIFFMFSLSY